MLADLCCLHKSLLQIGFRGLLRASLRRCDWCIWPLPVKQHVVVKKREPMRAITADKASLLTLLGFSFASSQALTWCHQVLGFKKHHEEKTMQHLRLQVPNGSKYLTALQVKKKTKKKPLLPGSFGFLQSIQDHDPSPK